MATGREVLSLDVSELEASVVILISAAYPVAQPEPYRHGIVLLFPPRAHDRVHAALDEVWRTLRLWLIGQLTPMPIIGLLTTPVVWLIGFHSPLALGLIAFVAEFIPNVGPIFAAAPALLVALSQSAPSPYGPRRLPRHPPVGGGAIVATYTHRVPSRCIPAEAFATPAYVPNRSTQRRSSTSITCSPARDASQTAFNSCALSQLGRRADRWTTARWPPRSG